MSLERVLIACRGQLARRLVEAYRQLGIETVAAFSEPDAEQGYLDDADFDVYLNGRTAEETYLDPERVLSAAMDAGCDAIHPGAGPLAGTPRLVTLAANANVGVIGADPQHLLEVVELPQLLARGRALGLEPIPAVPVPSGDGLAEAGPLGLPLRVVGSHGGAACVVERLEAVPDAVERVRRLAAARAGEGGAVLVTSAADARQVGTVVVGDRHGTRVQLGQVLRSVRRRGRCWVSELGPASGHLPDEALAAGAVALAEACSWIGVGVVRWSLLDGRHWLEGFEPRLPAELALIEAVQGVDLIEAQLRAVTGGVLGWEQPSEPDRAGLQAHVWHGDPDTGAVEEGTLSLQVPDVEGVGVEIGVDHGTPCGPDTEPRLLTLTAVHVDRSEALTRLRRAVDALRVDGVPSNVEALRAALGSEEVVR